jgi:hypothetical protein
MPTTPSMSYECLTKSQRAKILDALYLDWKDFIGKKNVVKKKTKSYAMFKSYFTKMRLYEQYPGLGDIVFRNAMNN